MNNQFIPDFKAFLTKLTYMFPDILMGALVPVHYIPMSELFGAEGALEWFFVGVVYSVMEW